MTAQTLNLRKQIRLERKKVSVFSQRQTQHKILCQIFKLPYFIHSKKIGLYLDSFGEVYTDSLIQLCFRLNKKVYLPRINPMNQTLRWVRVTKHQYDRFRFHKHPLGMYEPKQSLGIHVSQLDLLIMPLLACDVNGNRMGMGGGYYDRTLSTAPTKPYRLGIAHHFQLLQDPLEHRPWDQTLDGLVTPSIFLRFKR